MSDPSHCALDYRRKTRCYRYRQEFIVNGAITGVSEQFSLFPRKNQAWTVGSAVIRGIGFPCPGINRYMPTYGDAGLIKGAFVAKEYQP
ncbi:MAG: hypothetical protein R3C61_28950 [Bacteroidia bacterium]